MDLLPVIRFAKRVLPPNGYSLAKKYYALSSLRPFFLLLPYGMFPRFQYPRLLTISLTTRCNLQCLICRREGFKGEDLKFENIYKLEKAIRHAQTINLTGWGEPLLYPNLQGVLDYIYFLNRKDNLIQFTTNGTRLSDQTARLLEGHLKSVTISLNAATRETYNRQMKNGNFEKTLSAIKRFLCGLAEKDRIKIGLYFVAHTENFLEIPDFVILAHKLGISAVTIAHYLVGTEEHRQYSLLNVRDEYMALVDRATVLGKSVGVFVHAPRRFFSEKEQAVDECLSPFNECFIEVDGNVSPCCYCGNYSIGNVYKSTFENVWFSDAYRKLRKKRHLQGCQSCSAFLPLDECGAHFASKFKETPAFKQIEQEFKIHQGFPFL
jgi:radical SAM protein with 4Fe4S-binding SPASM domain